MNDKTCFVIKLVSSHPRLQEADYYVSVSQELFANSPHEATRFYIRSTAQLLADALTANEGNKARYEVCEVPA